MTTMVVRIESNANIRGITTAVRQLKGVAEVKVQRHEAFERIPGIPHTPEQLREAVRRSEEQYAQGRTVTIEQLSAKHPRI